MISDEDFQELFQIGVYPELLGVQDNSIRFIHPTKERTMTNEQATHVGALAAPINLSKLTDDQLAALLATKSIDGPITAYITDADEVDTDQATAPSPTIH